jgi:uncharacterized protein YjiS (DUF1127 family)
MARTPAAALLARAAWVPCAVLRRIAREREARRAAACLDRLDDRLLADVGLARDQILDAARQGHVPRR